MGHLTSGYLWRAGVPLCARVIGQRTFYDELMGKPAAAAHRAQMHALEEQMVDRLATVVAEHLPLPQFADGTAST